MSRNPELEAILQAKFDLDACADEQQESYRRRFNDLVNEALAKASHAEISREMLEESLREPYREFRLAKIREERAKLSRLR
jgi:hypothetical protein